MGRGAAGEREVVATTGAKTLGLMGAGSGAVHHVLRGTVCTEDHRWGGGAGTGVSLTVHRWHQMRRWVKGTNKRTNSAVLIIIALYQ